ACLQAPWGVVSLIGIDITWTGQEFGSSMSWTAVKNNAAKQIDEFSRICAHSDAIEPSPKFSAGFRRFVQPGGKVGQALFAFCPDQHFKALPQPRELRLLGRLGVAGGLLQRGVAKDGRNLVGAASGFRHSAPCGLAQPVRRALRQSRLV